MPAQPIALTDPDLHEVATVRVERVGDHYEGTIALAKDAKHLRAVFDEFEEIVEGQMFSLLDEIDERIDRLGLRVRFADGTTTPVADLQVFSSTNAVSFKTRLPTPVA